jgi:hypothetical protein
MHGETLRASITKKLCLLQVLESYQPLWAQLEDLDCHTQLLDPAAALAQPYSYCTRCISLGAGASCQFKLSPAAPRALPSSVVFHGPSAVVAALQNSWYSSAHKLWQEQQSVRVNLQAILQVRVLIQHYLKTVCNGPSWTSMALDCSTCWLPS